MKWLDAIKLIVLAILIIVLVCLLVLKKTNNEEIQKVVEAFQQNGPMPDIVTPFFDLSSNYFELSQEEVGAIPIIAPDDVILNIGGSFGNIDVGQIPWDSENASITMAQAAYGMVPQCASASIFAKLYMVNQLQDPSVLPTDPNTGKFQYNQPLFEIHTDDPKVALAGQIGQEIVTYGMFPLMAHGMYQQMGLQSLFRGSGPILKDIEGLSTERAAALAAGDFNKVSYLDITISGLKRQAAVVAFISDNFTKLAKSISEAVASGGGKVMKAFSLLPDIMKYIGAVILLPFKSTFIMFRGMGRAAVSGFKTAGKIASEVRGMAAASIALGAKSSTLIAEAVKLAEGAGVLLKFVGGLIKSAGKIIGKVLGKIMSAMNICGWIIYWITWLIVFIINIANPGGAGVASAAATIAMQIFDGFYMFVIMPVVLALSFSNTVSNALDKVSDSIGCCPDGSDTLDSLIPEWCSIIYGMCPVLGDLLSFFYPYVCFSGSGGGIVYRHSLTLPKYLYYPHLTTTFLRWPNYDCSTGHSPIKGKYISSAGCDWNNQNDGFYTNFNSIAKDPNTYKHTTMTWTNKQTKDYKYEYIMLDSSQNDPSVPFTPNTFTGNFFYADFSDPPLLLQMAQFYYDNASRDINYNIDGTVSVMYISKINYVAASSLYSCDVMCEMVTVTYNPINGQKYGEQTSYDHDRRFYFNVDKSKEPAPFWEKMSVGIFMGMMIPSMNTWMTLDDAYDNALYKLNDALHVDQNSNLSAEILLTAYVQKLESFERFSNASINAINAYPTMYGTNTDVNDPTVISKLSSNYFVNQFYNIYLASQSNYYSLYSNTGLPQPTTFDTILGNTNDAAGSLASANNIHTYLDAVVNASNALYAQHLIDRPITMNSNDSNYNTQYKVVACTKIDQTGSAAYEADTMLNQSDSRYKVDLNVRPYLKLCQTTHMNLIKCMDPSNLELIIYDYYLKNPNKRIRTIKSIKAKGHNACEYIWDEDDLTDDKISASYSDVKTEIYYQMDLSSCTFCLPPGNVLVGKTKGNGNMTPVSSLYTRTAKTIQSGNVNYSLYNGNLDYIQAFYNTPIFDSNNNFSDLVNVSNVDYIPRFYPFTFQALPDLIRPKQPLRVFYPQYIASNLGSIPYDTCANPNTINQFLLDYNASGTNSNKILKVLRAYTSDSNKCDYEVDMMYTNNTVQRRTLTATMKPETGEGIPPKMREGFTQSSNNAEVYFVYGSYTLNQAASVCSNYNGSLATLVQLSNAASNGASFPTFGWAADSNTYTVAGNNLTIQGSSGSNAALCFGIKPKMIYSNIAPFNAQKYYFETVYTTDQSVLVDYTGGLNIQQNTEKLEAPFLDGYGFNNAYIDLYNNSVIPNITYFNDNLITNFTSNMQYIFDSTRKLQVAISANNYLGTPGECAPQISCSDPDIMGRIMQQFNVDNTPKLGTSYRGNQSNMTYIFKVGTADGSNCRVMFDNQVNQYNNYDTYVAGNTSSSNFLYNDGRVAFINVKMVEDSPCVFKPVEGQTYSNVLVSDPYLASEDLLPYPYFSAAINLPSLDFANSNIYIGVLLDYQATLKNKIISLDYAMQISPNIVDYRITQKLIHTSTYSDSKGISHTIITPITTSNNIIRASFTIPLYNTQTGYSKYIYNSGNFVLQMFGDLTKIINVDPSNMKNILDVSLSSNYKYISPLMYIGTTHPPSITYTTIKVPINISLP